MASRACLEASALRQSLAIERVSRRELGLSEKSLRRLEALEESLEVMVFATPT